MAKATDKQRKHPVVPKKTKSKPNKRNIDDLTESNTVQTKKIKIVNIEKHIDETKLNNENNDKNKENGSIDNEQTFKIDIDGNKTNEDDIDDMKTDSEDEKSNDDDTENSTKDSKSNKIVPLIQARPQINALNSSEPIFEPQPQDANEASKLTIGYCETLVGFNATGKKNMLDNLSETEISILRSWVRKEGFRMIKFLSPSNLGIHSPIMTKMYAHLSIFDEKVKMKKYTGLRYLLQRQLNSKRNYCIANIVSQMKGMKIIWIFIFITLYCLLTIFVKN